MRTTIDLPDALLRRAKESMRRKNLTFRALVITALERVLEEGETAPFRLRDASVGDMDGACVSSQTINEVIEDQRRPGIGA